MTTVNSIKNRVDALSPDEGPIPTDPKKMTDRQLITRIIKDRYNRPPTAWELTSEGSSQLIEILRLELDENVLIKTNSVPDR
jgi:hypothetical protein